MKKQTLVYIACCVFVILILAPAVWWSWDQRYYHIARNFRVIEPGRIFAGGYQHPRPMRRIMERHRIKTVLSIAFVGDDNEIEEDETLAAAGVRLVRMRFPQHASDAERLAAAERTVAFFNDPENQPVYVHCWGGRHRTGIVIAVHRLSNCNWDEAAALRELIRFGGDAEGTVWPTRLLHAYAQQKREVAREIPVETFNR